MHINENFEAVGVRVPLLVPVCCENISDELRESIRRLRGGESLAKP